MNIFINKHKVIKCFLGLLKRREIFSGLNSGPEKRLKTEQINSLTHHCCAPTIDGAQQWCLRVETQQIVLQFTLQPYADWLTPVSTRMGDLQIYPIYSRTFPKLLSLEIACCKSASSWLMSPNWGSCSLRKKRSISILPSR